MLHYFGTGMLSESSSWLMKSFRIRNWDGKTNEESQSEIKHPSKYGG
jgi:hypothetical protein